MTDSHINNAEKTYASALNTMLLAHNVIAQRTEL